MKKLKILQEKKKTLGDMEREQGGETNDNGNEMGFFFNSKLNVELEHGSCFQQGIFNLPRVSIPLSLSV